jgi:hypothetical protein
MVSENNFKTIHETIEERIDPNNIRFYNDETFGDKLKKFAFFEVKMRSKTENLLLEYLENSIIEALKN